MSSTTNSKIWVSDPNARPEIRSAFPRTLVRFYDTTLRDGEQTVGVVLSPQQKLEIAISLDELGVSRIEAGFPRVSPEDGEAIQPMEKAGLKAELWGFSRAVKADVEELLRLGLAASDSIFLPLPLESLPNDSRIAAYVLETFKMDPSGPTWPRPSHRIGRMNRIPRRLDECRVGESRRATVRRPCVAEGIL